MFRFKELPEPVSITKDRSAFVVGWTGDRSFIVRELNLPETPSASDQINSIIDSKRFGSISALDGDEEEPSEKDYLSLWEWAKKKGLKLNDFDNLQESLETYLPQER